MFSVSASRYFVFGQPTDMRKSFDGLCGLVVNGLGQNPMNGDVFVFINRPRNRIKLLRWEPGGYVLFYKRLEKGTFELPPWGRLQGLAVMSYGELAMMVTGISMRNAKKRPRFLSQNTVQNSTTNYEGSMI